MPSLTDRPYIGTFKPNKRKVVRLAPDIVVFFNGETSLSDCAKCASRIDLQKYITSVSVEAGTSIGSHSANISLSLPTIFGEKIFEDGKNKIFLGMEVRIFARGYFPLQGQFAHISDPNFEDLDLSNLASTPYYPIFHGLITGSSYDYSDGFYSGSLQCQSLLHFWQFVNLSVNGAVLAQKPDNSNVRSTVMGNNLNNMHPYALVYTLYRDIAGAAAAVEFALSGQTNLGASDGAEGLWSQVSKYWEKRFSNRLQSLRMYGANGRLFNSAQQAFFAKFRDFSGQIPAGQYTDQSTAAGTVDPFSKNYSVSKALGLAPDGFDTSFSNIVSETGEVQSINMLDMYAFTQSLGQVGEFQLFETQYMSKAEIVGEVTRITGFEFYQDVDGDLVFKPPFYNLDTSSNRIYRLEDQDILNINFTEKEPDKTYIKVTGSWFKNFTDVVSNSGVTAKKAIYVDYRLVAQFGWRPHSLDVAYTDDPRTLFFLGMAHLDLANIDRYTASVTIPFRPELRPGFPVYIPFVDSYYYITQISHTFSFGAACTTTLTLTCRRTKVYAPGEQRPVEPGQDVNDLLKLERTDLPPRPVQILENGRPKLAGFPNLVLALDPARTNPAFFPVGAGIEHTDTAINADLFINFIRQDIAGLVPQILVVSPEFADANGNVLSQISDEEVVYKLLTGPNPEDFVQIDLRTLVGGFLDNQAVIRDIQDKRSQIFALSEQVNLATKAQQILSSPSETNPLTNQLIQLESEVITLQDSLRESFGGIQGFEVGILIQVFEAFKNFRGSPSRRKLSGVPDSDTQASYFDLLTHLKGQYTSTSLPGNYRYYSCSHPKPSYQGLPAMRFKGPVRSPGTSPSTLGVGSPPSGGLPTYTPPPQNFSGQSGTQLSRKVSEVIRGIPGTEEWIGSNTRIRRSIVAPKYQERMTDLVAQNMIDIFTAATQLVQRCLASPGWPPGQKLELLSSFRAGSEDGSSEAWHKSGLAVDILVQGTNARSPRPPGGEITTPEGRAWFVLCQETAKMRVEGFFVGVGAYQSGSGYFVHVDRRNRDTAKALGLDFKVGAWTMIKDTDSSDFWGGITKALNLPRLREATSKPRPLNRPTLAPTLGTGSPTPPAPSPSFAPAVSAPPRASASIQVKPLPLPKNRAVVGFVPPTRQDASQILPEADLGIIRCSRGFAIAQGPGGVFSTLSTDQIQTVSFAIMSMNVETAAVGTSVASSTTEFSTAEYRRGLELRFEQAIATVQDPSQTPEQVFQGLYDEITSRILPLLQSLPEFQNGELLGRLEGVNFREFRVLFKGNESKSFTELSQLEGFVAPAAKSKDSQNLQPVLKRCAEICIEHIMDRVQDSYDIVMRFSKEPSEGRQERFAEINKILGEITDASVGTSASPILTNAVEDKTERYARIDRPISVPVFPVSDDKGYEHFGSFRYGRGLSIETGGTFQFLHSKSDPVANVSSQTAEEYLQALTLVKSSGGGAQLQGVREAAAQVAQEILDQNQTRDGATFLSREELAKDAAQGLADARLVASQLSKTPKGQEALREILQANGDDPNIISQRGWDVSNSQFERNFANFSASYAANSELRTTVANAAVRMADLASYVRSDLGIPCSCRGNYADVNLEAYGLSAFVDITDSDAATEFHKDVIEQAEPAYQVQRDILSGKIKP